MSIVSGNIEVVWIKKNILNVLGLPRLLRLRPRGLQLAQEWTTLPPGGKIIKLFFL
jgi:hypothetical protein